MAKPRVLIEGSDPFALDASDLLLAADMKPVRGATRGGRIDEILHEIQIAGTGSVIEIAKRIQTEAKKALSRHRNQRIVFCVPDMPAKKYVQLVAEPGLIGDLELTNDTSAAVALIVRAKRVGEWKPAPEPTAEHQFILDNVAGIDSFGDDLRDDKTGRLNAKKVGELFGINIPAIADVVGLSRQALNDNPVSDRAQPLLRVFERLARLRSMPQFKEPADLRKWFKRPLPVFSNQSAEDLFKAGKLEDVASVVDRLLTGDFGG
jgi:hypothetical protein